MSDTIITLPDGSTWRPSSSKDTVSCVNCENEVDTLEEIASYPDGKCPDCGESWTGSGYSACANFWFDALVF